MGFSAQIIDIKKILFLLSWYIGKDAALLQIKTTSIKPLKNPAYLILILPQNLHNYNKSVLLGTYSSITFKQYWLTLSILICTILC